MPDPSDSQAVENQPPLLHYDAFQTDLPLREALEREGGAWAREQVAAYGILAGGEMMALGTLANENRPRFKPVDPYGRRIDQVEFHPAYHRLMTLGVARWKRAAASAAR